MIVIGLTGLARAGKDSVADILVRDHGFVKMSFAAPLKRMTRNLNPIVGHGVQLGYCDYDECDDPECVTTYAPVYLQDLYDKGWTEDEMKASEYGDEVRRLWQRFGTDTMRAEQDDYWIQAAMRDLLLSGHERVVFTDCRFPNEADMIYMLSVDHEDINSSVWQIVRPGVERREGAHVSETYVGLMGEEVTIYNDGSLEDLAEPVKDAMNYVGGRANPGGWVHAGYLTDGGVTFEGEK